MINPDLLRSDSFEEFFTDRQERLLALIETATGRRAYKGAGREEGEDVDADTDGAEAAQTMPAA